MLADLPYVGFIPVADTGSARDFYEGVLGLPVLEDTPFAVVVKAGGTHLRLTPVADLQPQPFTIAGWSTPDIDATVGGLVGRGLAFNRYDGLAQDELGIWTAPGGDRVAWFQDPFGNTLSVSTAGTS